MSKEKPEEQVFEVERIRELIELMKEHDLSEVDLRQSDRRIRLRRGSDQPQMIAMPSQAPLAPGVPVAAPTAMASESAEPDNSIYINSPTVGTFYSSPKPDAPSFVKVGDVIDVDTIVCLVEAMKMYNEIPAGVAGKIVECLAKNEDAVDVNQPLFKIEPV